MSFKKKAYFFIFLCTIIIFFLVINTKYNNTLVEDDDLLEYAETYLETYKAIIDASNLDSNDLNSFSFYQGYPYSVNAIISASHGASIAFIENSTVKNRASKIPYPIENLIPKVAEKDKRNIGFMLDNSSNNEFIDINTGGSFIYVGTSKDNSFFRINETTPILFGDGAFFDGLTYIESSQFFREGNFSVNGTLVLDHSKIIIKGSTLKTDWTTEKAKEDAIDMIYKEQIDGIFDYSKLTGIGYYEIELLVTDFKKKESMGYYEKGYEKEKDRDAIFAKAKQYRIPEGSVTIELLEHKQDKDIKEKIYDLIDKSVTIYTFVLIIIGGVSWLTRKSIIQAIKYFLK
ncbi:hypothetical protein [Methanomethylovorans sp.]|uniref:hypothetical protein n=1 Tax=Methanomethylovorans sp. TaxID=2758717 RepID=UPI00351C6F04